MTETNGAEVLAARKSVARVWIDHDLCTGDGLCEEIEPAIFELNSDGIAYVKEGGVLLMDEGEAGMANVPEDKRDAVIEAAQECPGECIFVATSAGEAVPLTLLEQR